MGGMGTGAGGGAAAAITAGMHAEMGNAWVDTELGLLYAQTVLATMSGLLDARHLLTD